MSVDSISERLEAKLPDLSPAEQAVGRFFADEGPRLGYLSANEVAEQLGVSDATVVRTAQSLGYRGFAELKRSSRADIGGDTDLRTRLLATLTERPEHGGGLAHVLDAHVEALRPLATLAAGPAFDTAVQLLARANRVVLSGTGPSAALASYGQIQLARIGLPGVVLSHTGVSAADEIVAVRGGDVAVVLAYGRVHHHVTVLFEHCAERQVPVVLCTDTATLPGEPENGVTLRSGRGLPGHFASHATTTLLLEAFAIELAARNPDRATAALDAVNAARRRLAGRDYDVR